MTKHWAALAVALVISAGTALSLPSGHEVWVGEAWYDTTDASINGGNPSFQDGPCASPANVTLTIGIWYGIGASIDVVSDCNWDGEAWRDGGCHRRENGAYHCASSDCCWLVLQPDGSIEYERYTWGLVSAVTTGELQRVV